VKSSKTVLLTTVVVVIRDFSNLFGSKILGIAWSLKLCATPRTKEDLPEWVFINEERQRLDQ